MSLAGIPPAELPFIPGMEPPNGTLSNFIDPPNRADVYIIVAAIFLGLATISVVLKLYVRLFVQRSPWWDDCKYRYSSRNAEARPNHLVVALVFALVCAPENR